MAVNQFLLISNYYPEIGYELSDGHRFNIVKNPYSDLEEIKKGYLSFLGGQSWKYSITIPESFKYIVDLIIFHSFVTNNSQTYHYGEIANKLSFSNEELETCEISSLKKLGEKIKIVDFNCFPLLMNCNLLPESDQKIESVDYRTLFEMFIELKTKEIEGISGKYNLYNLISLFEYAKSFETTHKIYRNSNLAVSFYITILEALIGKPENCSAKVHCEKCRSMIPHSKISLEKHFQNYFRQFKKFRSVRHGTYHGGKYFDFNKHFSKLAQNKIDWTKDKKYIQYHHEREEMECVIRMLLTGELFNYYFKTVGTSHKPM